MWYIFIAQLNVFVKRVRICREEKKEGFEKTYWNNGGFYQRLSVKILKGMGEDLLE